MMVFTEQTIAVSKCVDANAQQQKFTPGRRQGVSLIRLLLVSVWNKKI